MRIEFRAEQIACSSEFQMYSKILGRRVAGISPSMENVYFTVNVLSIGEFHWASLCNFALHTGMLTYAKAVKILQHHTVKILQQHCSAANAKRLRLRSYMIQINSEECPRTLEKTEEKKSVCGGRRHCPRRVLTLHFFQRVCGYHSS